MDPASLAEDLEAEIAGVVTDGNAPSIQAAVVYQDQIIWSQAFGENTSVNHGYMNASVQKMFTAVAVLQLAEQGLIDLDADVQEYLPFPIRHPDYPETPISVRMLLSQRSGMTDFPNQFEWDTACAFRQYRPRCPDQIVAMPIGEFLSASLRPDGGNYQPGIWGSEPGQSYYYSVSAFPMLRYLVGLVSGLDYPEYMQANIFEPLGMEHSGFIADGSASLHTTPYTRINDQNVELPLWNGQGWMMHTTAEDMAHFMGALMNDGQYNSYQLLASESVALMQQTTTSSWTLLRSGEDLVSNGFGLGLFSFRGGWFGFGGSAPGYQSLLRYHPERQVGYVIMANVNGILSSEYDSVREDIYHVQDALVSILDPTLTLRSHALEMLLFSAAGLVWLVVMRKRAKLLASSGAVWIAFGAIWLLRDAPVVGMGLLILGLISLAGGMIVWLNVRQRQASRIS
ncbi:MAG: serine hydrolase domain-containing protein [Anaerolineales bacterium]|jgi:CubicO group peptidase (beta-lactamase class C family)